MATPKNPAPASLPPDDDGGPRPGRSLVGWVAHLLDSAYHFLASLKLAVISLASLAAVLAYATFFEKWYGAAAAQEWIYRGKGFAILLAFLGANILCAALIRYPWKRRQTGFVITHAGLLILLGGSWYSLMTADEGSVGALEGETKEELVRSDYPVVRVQQLDPKNPSETVREWELPFRPGAFGWGPGQPKPQAPFAALNPLHWLDKGDPRQPTDVLTRPDDPFQFVVKSHIPASMFVTAHEADPAGSPMAEIRPTFKGPGMPQGRDVFRDAEERWFASDTRLHRVVKTEGPAQFAFQYVESPELVEDFLNPPADPGKDGVVRFRYTDKAGKRRTFDFALDGQQGKTIPLPDSDLTAKFVDLVLFPARDAGLNRTLDADTIPLAEFEIKQGDKAPVKHIALASLPTFPNVIPTPAREGEPAARALADLTYYLPPTLDPKGSGLFGQVEVLGTPEGNLYYRVFGRPEANSGKTRGQVRGKGPLKVGEEVVAFGGNPNMPMTIAFAVPHYYPKGAAKEVCEPLLLSRAQMGEGIPASLVAMTIKDPEDPSRTVTKEFFIRRSHTLDATWQTVAFPVGKPGSGEKAFYRVSYDMDRRPLGFQLHLDDFDVGFDPGTEQASSFASQVRLTDKAAGIENKPVTISMNEPLTHRGYTFYQSSYNRMRDPATGRETGEFQSVFQVGSDPGRNTKYLGCLLVVLGAFVQFYMRAGLFTDGGKRERAKAAPSAGANGHPADPGLIAAADARARASAADDETL